MTTQQDDFLAEVSKTETQARNIIEKAREHSRIDQEKHMVAQSKKREDSLFKEKEKSKTSLQEKQIVAKEIYKDLLKEGKKEADKLKREAEKNEDKVLSAAEVAFLNDII